MHGRAGYNCFEFRMTVAAAGFALPTDSDAFEAIEAAGDISPSIVAGALKAVWAYPILGMLTLAISCVFRYVNQYQFEVTR